MRILVLGCGPSGLVAAHAAFQLGHQVTILSKKREPSLQYGCQYLHAPIPGYEDVPSVTVSYQLNGTPEQYRKKVYGDFWQGKVSPEDFIGEHRAWDIRETYNRMWNDYGKFVNQYTIVNGDLSHIRAGYDPDIIVSTIPVPDLCHNAHHMFASHMIYANGSTAKEWPPENHIICNGTDQADWYRISNVFGYRTIEWPYITGPIGGSPRSVKVTKPLKTECDCHPEVIRAGRYGEWDKSVLVHQVYQKVVEALS